jgi:uncharacterized RmlC-like cupin family protein
MSQNKQGECVVVRSGKTHRGAQGLDYFTGISAQTAGSRGLCLHLVTLPPGGRSAPHMHEGHETALYVLSGESETWYGEGLRKRAVAKKGDFLYIPAGVPHMPVNLSATEPCLAVIARTDPNVDERMKVLPGSS